MSAPEFYNTLFVNNKIISSEEIDEQQEAELNANIKTLIFCSETHDEALNSLLENIMKTCKLEQKFTVTTPKPWRLYRNLNIREVLLFGVTEEELQLNIQLPKNWPMKFDNTTWIKTDTLADLEKHKNLKNDFWLNALRPYFFPS